ncbi:protein adenylyltransferase SelO [Pseudactinotalea sp. Z1739]|uniref:protein adenylyltransferase SelO n=1 Tax=Pseudactinotalea sp. Z1739 TaxID=3413028 RepID=UPI003C7C4236
MTTTAPPSNLLHGTFARELPELAVPWQAEKAPEPRLVALNDTLADELGLDPEYLRSPSGLRFLLGNEVPEGATPVAQAYAGHQFGTYVPRLGDGRALLLGELTDAAGNLRDLHLKGSGPTPFARGGDGLAAVGPMLREFLISEALHALGVPTTRSLSVVATGQAVMRERPLPGAVLARVADSHLRVGTFAYARSTGDEDLLRRLADHAITRHHPQAREAENPYLALFEAVLAAQAELVAKWMLIGFVHGVMNTDNTTISGQSIDYGPCAFMDAFDPGTVFSSIDALGRYAYGRQPQIAQWNLARFAETLLPLISADQEQAVESATAALDTFPEVYSAVWTRGMRAKLGLESFTPDDDATALIRDLTSLLGAWGVDYTSFFRHLTTAAGGDAGPVRVLFGGAGDDDVSVPALFGDADSDQVPVPTLSGSAGGVGVPAPASLDGNRGDPASSTERPAFEPWLQRWLSYRPDASVMAQVNPIYIPRNHLVEEALAAAGTADLGPFEELLDVITQPFTERPGLERYTEPAPAEAAPFVTYCGT